MRVLVTGGAGFIGSHLVDFHLHRGDFVIAIDNFSAGRRENIESFLSHPRFRLIEGDVRLIDLQELISQSDRVYHMAALVGMKLVLSHPVEAFLSNIEMSAHVLQEVSISKNRPRVLIASSSCVYQCQDFAKEDDPLLSIPAGQYKQHMYALSKISSEAIADGYINQGLHCVIARPFNVIGPRQTGRYGMVVPNFIEQALRGDPITVYGDGKQTRAFCDVRDAVHAMHLSLEKEACKNQIVNIGYPQEISIYALAEKIKEKTKSSSPIVFVPYQEAYGMEFYDIQRRNPVIDHLQQWTGFVPQYGLEDTLDAIIDAEKKKRVL